MTDNVVSFPNAAAVDTVEPVIGDDILTLADKLQELREHKKELAEAVKENNQNLDAVEAQLSAAMVEVELQNFKRAGKTFYLLPQTFCSIRRGMNEQLFAWLRDNGAEDLVRETVFASSLKSYVKELREEDGDVPEKLAELINIHDKIAVGMRNA